MDDPALFAELSRVAEKLGVSVRVELFETPPAGAGGLCVVHGPAARPPRRARRVRGPRPRPRPARSVGCPSRMSTWRPTLALAIEAMTVSDGAAPGARVAGRATTLGVGGPARSSWRRATRRRPGGAGLGGGARAAGAGARRRLEPGRRRSGVEALVLQIAPGARRRGRHGDELTAAAGEPWDDVVAARWSAGGPGWSASGGSRAGRRDADPERRRLRSGRRRDHSRPSEPASARAGESWPRADRCGFAYRDSAFKARAGALRVLARDLPLRPAALRPCATPSSSGTSSARARHAFARRGAGHRPGLAAAKSMVIEPGRPNRRSAGRSS